MKNPSSAPPTAPPAPVYVLRGCEVRVANREIAAEGGFRQIEPRAFDVLVYLIEHRDRVVSKEELAREVWHRLSASDSVVARTVMKARLAISDLLPDEPLIRTAHSVGYRFVGAVGLSGLVAAPKPTPAADADELVHLAVLPFENRTGLPQKAGLELGVMSQVATALAAHRRLRVAPVSAVLMALEGTRSVGVGQSAHAVREALGVQLVVHVTVSASASGDCHEMRGTIHAAQGVRELPVIRCPCSSIMVTQLIDALQDALLPEPVGERVVAEHRFPDRFSADVYARARQAMAEQYWRVAAPLLQVLVDQQPDMMGLRLDLLRALVPQGEAAAPALARHLLQAAGPNDHELKASVLCELGAYELGFGRLNEATGHLDAALAHQGGGDEFLLRALLPRIALALRQNDFDSARLHVGQAEAVIARGANRVYRTALLRHAATLECRSGNLQRAIELAEEALAMARDLRLRHGVLAGLRTRAGVLVDAGRLVEAVACGEEALALAIALGNTRYAAHSGATLCFLFATLRRPVAVERVLATLEDEVAGNDPWIPGALAMARACLAGLRRDPAAVAQGYAALSSSHHGGKQLLMRHRLWPAAGLLLAHSRLRQEALALIDDARATFESDADAAQCGGLDLVRGHLAFVDGDRAGALRHFIAAAERSTAGMWRSLACLDGAWLCCEAGDVREAERLLLRAGRWGQEHPAGRRLHLRLRRALACSGEADPSSEPPLPSQA